MLLLVAVYYLLPGKEFNEKSKSFTNDIFKRCRKFKGPQPEGVVLGIDKSKLKPIIFDKYIKSEEENSVIIGKSSAHPCYICKECGRPFGDSAKQLIAHLKIVHDIDVTVIDSVGSEYKELI